MVDPESFTGSDRPLLTRIQAIASERRRLHWLLPNGSRHVVTIKISDDSDDYRRRIGDALMADRHARIRRGKIIPQ